MRKLLEFLIKIDYTNKMKNVHYSTSTAANNALPKLGLDIVTSTSPTI